MGVVVRQGLKSTIVQFVGVAVGVASVLFLFPRALEAYGLVQTLIAAASVLAPLTLLGASNVAVRYYAPFRDPDAGRRGLLTLTLGVAGFGIALTVLAWPLLRHGLYELYGDKLADGEREYLLAVPVLVAAIVLARVLAQYTSNFRRIVVPTLLDQFAFKLTLPALIVLLLAGAMTVRGVVIGAVAHYVLIVVGLVVYLVTLGELRLPRIDASLVAKWREMASFGAYSVAAQVASGLAFRIDQVMLPAYLGLEAAGQYSLVLFISEVIAKPFANLRAVAAPLVSEAWTLGDMVEMQTLYRKSSDNLLLICGYVFIGITVCYPSLVAVTAKGEVLAQVFVAFLVLGIGRLVDSATSINDLIITYSARYRFNLLAVVVLAVVNVALNVVLIPRYGFVGAAAATVVSLTLANTAKVVFVGVVWGLWPFGKTTLAVAAAVSAAGLSGWLLPSTSLWWLDIGLKGGLVTVLLAVYVWYFPPSIELRKLMTATLGRLGIAT